MGGFWFVFFSPPILLLQNKRPSLYILKGGKKPTNNKKAQTHKPLGGCADLLISFEKSFLFCSCWEMKLSLPRATAERASAGSGGGKRGNNCPARPTEKKKIRKKKEKEKKKISLKKFCLFGSEGSVPVPGSGRAPPRRAPSPARLSRRSPAPDPPGGYRSPRKATAGGGSGQLGARRGCGGGPFYLPFPSALPCPSPPTRPSPRPARLPAAAELPGFPGAGEGEGGRGKRARGLGWR